LVKIVIYYVKMVVVALLSVDLVESVDLVSVELVVNCIFLTFLEVDQIIYEILSTLPIKI